MAFNYFKWREKQFKKESEILKKASKRKLTDAEKLELLELNIYPYSRDGRFGMKKALKHAIKLLNNESHLTKKTITVADFSFLEDNFKSVGFWAEKRDDEYKVDYVFEINIKDEEPITISTVDKAEARLWATQLNIDLQAWEREIKIK